MPPWMELILIVTCVSLVIHTVSLSDQLKLTNDLLDLSKNETNRLRQQLAELSGEKGQRNTKTYSELDFLDADDPLGALLKEVGRVRPGQ